MNTLTSTTVDWPPVTGAAGYEITVSGSPGLDTVTIGSYTVAGLQPGEVVSITVRTLSSTSCPDAAAATLDCAAAELPRHHAELTDRRQRVLPGGAVPVTLTATAAGGSGTDPVFTWSGPGVTGDSFDPVAAGVGQHTITVNYTEDGGLCGVIGMATVDVFANPTADFTLAPAAACTDTEVTATYTGTAGAGATYAWDFGGGMAVPGTGAGPHQITWTTAGTKTVTLTVTENGCASMQTTQTTEISAPLATPDVTCGASTLTSVTFDWTPISGATQYEVTLPDASTVTVNTTSYTATGLTVDQTYTISVVAFSSGPCGNSAAGMATCTADGCSAITVSFDPVATSYCLGQDGAVVLTATAAGGSGNQPTYVFSGNGVSDDGAGNFTFDPVSAGVGVHAITVAYEEDGGLCGETAGIDLTVFAVPTADFTVSDDDICSTETVTITYAGTATAGATYAWDFDGGTAVPGTGAGPHQVTWTTAGTKTITLTVTENGCTGAQNDLTVDVAVPLATPVVTCDDNAATLGSVTFSWTAIAGAEGYLVTLDDGTMETVTATTYTISGLATATAAGLSVIAVSSGACGNSAAGSASCTSLPCPDITLNVTTPAQNFCIDNPTLTALTATTTGGDQTGTFTWTGPGVTDDGAGNFSFDPALAGLGTHVVFVNYVETGNCTAEGQVSFTVFPALDGSFTVSTAAVCTGEALTVEYTGNGSAAATFAWDFAGATADPGTGIGPHQLSFAAAGTYTITLLVTENGCTSPQASRTVTVSAPLAAANLTCGTAELTAVTWNWGAVAGATGYELSVDGGTPFTTTDVTYTLTGLSPEQTATLTVTPLGPPPCGNGPATSLECAAAACPDVTLSLPAANSFCIDGQSNTVIDLTATSAGGTGQGTFTWSGPGVTGNQFTAEAAGPGVHTLTVTYTETVCTYTGTVVFTVFQTPTAAFTLSQSTICAGASTTLTFTGSAEAGAAYNWNFAGASAVPGTGAGPHQLSWTTPGTYTVSLTVTGNGCTGNTFTAEVTVEAPLSAGEQAQQARFCNTESTTLTLFDQLTGADAGGAWSSTGPAPGANFSAANGTLALGGLAPNVYTFRYRVDGGSCGTDDAAVSVEINAGPRAEAGADQTLTCAMGMVSLDGGGSQGGPGFTYQWTADDPGIMIGAPTNRVVEVSQPGTYTLAVTNELGCTNTDEVVVTAETEVPVATIELSQITCFAGSDGAIRITGVTGGRPPYRYSLNDAAPVSTTLFGGLAPAEYTLRIEDANGCFTEFFLDITQPDELRVSITLLDPVGEDIRQGDDVTLRATIRGGNAVDTIIWMPDSLANQTSEGNVITFQADETRRISVSVVDELGCRASDNLLLIVRKDRPVFIPNGFSPNGDGANDVFFINADPRFVDRVESFQVYNRWGESMFEDKDFLPNDPAHGWGGMHRLREMNTGVYIYVAIVHFFDGEVITYKGDVTLTR